MRIRNMLRRVAAGLLLVSAVPGLAVGGALDPAPRLDLAPLGPAALSTAGLERAIADLQAVASAGGFVRVPNGETLEPGDRHAAVSALARRLAQSGDLTAGEAAERRDPERYDPVLAAAVRRFQARHGLAVDGVVGPNTLARLNESAESLIARATVNMARQAAAPSLPMSRHIVVNVPAFELRAYRQGRPVLTMKVVVGRTSRATPEMSAPMTHLVVNPSWTVPAGILRKDVARHMLEDTGYLASHALRLIGGDAGRDPLALDWQAIREGRQHVALRQGPGPTNPLGRFRFQLQNDLAIYLHDTSDPHLFARAERTFSSGCVRVERPWDLAEFVAEGVAEPWRDWARSSAWRTRWVPLPEPIPVRLEYRTVWVDEDGVLQVRKDVYGRDRRDLLAEGPAADIPG